MLLLPLMLGILTRCHNPLNSKTAAQEIFKVSRDTIHVSIDGRLDKALLINDKYYAFYEVRDPMSTLPIKKFYIITKSGKIEKDIKVPEGIHNDYYSKLYYWHGRIMVNTESYTDNINSYYLDEDKGEFVKTREFIKVRLFDDENYQVTSECKGEWGSTIYFNNKAAHTAYSTNSGCPVLVNKLGSKYFVNTTDMLNNDIMEIDDPIKMETKTVFSNNNLDSHFHIATSFVTKGILYHIYNSYQNAFRIDEKKERVVVTKDSANIGIITNGEFKPVYKLIDKFDIEFQQQVSPEYQICTFHTEERMEIGFKKDIPPYREAKYGFIEIMGNEIKIHYFISKKAG
jgi:hypothetical protein